MDISPAKAAANAANAQLSTGPRTEEGKAHSSQNAIKHGLTAQQVVVREEEKQKFDDLRDSMLADLTPQGAVELQTFNIVLHASWNLDRFRTLEANLMVNGLDPLLDDSSSKVLDRLHRYHNQTLRNYHKALKELRALQTNRELRNLLDEEIAKQVPLLARIEVVLRESRAEDKAGVIASAGALNEAMHAAFQNERTRIQNKPTAPAKEGR